MYSDKQKVDKKGRSVDIGYFVRNKYVCEGCWRKAMRNPRERIRQFALWGIDQLRFKVFRARTYRWSFEYGFAGTCGYKDECSMCGTLLRGFSFYEFKNEIDYLRDEHGFLPLENPNIEPCESHDYLVCDHNNGFVWIFCKNCSLYRFLEERR